MHAFFHRSAPQIDDSSPLANPVPAPWARALILSGRAPAGMQVEGHLDLSNCTSLVELPDHLTVDSLDLSGCSALQFLPRGLQARRLTLNGCVALRELPPGLCMYELHMKYTTISALPSDLCVEYRLDLEGCDQLRTLPEGLTVGALILRNCTRLGALPEGLSVCFLDISGCTRLTSLPRRATIEFVRLSRGDGTFPGVDFSPSP